MAVEKVGGRIVHKFFARCDGTCIRVVKWTTCTTKLTAQVSRETDINIDVEDERAGSFFVGSIFPERQFDIAEVCEENFRPWSGLKRVKIT